MNFSSALPALMLCCFIHVSLTTCKPLESMSEDEFNQKMQKLDQKIYREYLLHSIPAASAGKNLFKMSQSVSENCTRTAKAILELLYKPSITPYASDVIVRSIDDAVELHYFEIGTFHSHVEAVCYNLDLEARRKSIIYNYEDFEQMKETVRVPKPAKNYVVEFQAGQSVAEWGTARPTPIDELEMIEFEVIVRVMQFRLTKIALDESQYESMVIAKAIAEVTRFVLYEHSWEMDTVFLKTLDDFVKNPPTQRGNIIHGDNLDFFASEFLKKVDQNSLNNDLVKGEYDKQKKAVMNQVLRLPSKLLSLH